MDMDAVILSVVASDDQKNKGSKRLPRIGANIKSTQAPTMTMSSGTLAMTERVMASMSIGVSPQRPMVCAKRCSTDTCRMSMKGLG